MEGLVPWDRLQQYFAVEWKVQKVHNETVTLGWGERNKTLQTFSILYQQDGETKFHVGKPSTS